jgi:hypothetical protein
MTRLASDRARRAVAEPGKSIPSAELKKKFGLWPVKGWK